LRWMLLQPLGTTPPAMTGHSLTFSTADGNVYLFGGLLYPEALWPNRGRQCLKPHAHTMYKWHRLERSWSALTHAQHPSPRMGHSMTSSETSLWLFGGRDHAMQCLNDLWEFDIRTGLWRSVVGAITPDVPTPRMHASMFLSGDAKDLLVVCGGVGPLEAKRNPKTLRSTPTMSVFLLEGSMWVWSCGSCLVESRPQGRRPARKWLNPHHCVLTQGGTKLVGIMCETSRGNLVTLSDAPRLSSSMATRIPPGHTSGRVRDGTEDSVGLSEDSGKRRRTSEPSHAMIPQEDHGDVAEKDRDDNDVLASLL